ncbi:MAG: hypothetical protein JJ895_07405 [Balneolaceae bacterium]|nr:hypothetical protein [Balneolaceae bacterium]
MARIHCTIQEYHRFLGPLIRNKVNSLTRKERLSRNKICEFCGDKSELESAHIHGKGRKKIIEYVLNEYLSDNYVHGNLLEIEKKIIEAHLPLESTFKFICKPCHTLYDKNKHPDLTIQEKPAPINSNLTEYSDFKKLNRIELWSKRKHQTNHKMIKAFLELSLKQKVTFEQLKNICTNKKYEIDEKKFLGNYLSMKTDKGNSHGKVFFENNGYIEIYPVVMNEIKEYFNT